MYMGYEISPSNFPVSPSLLAAAAVTMAGKKSITQSTSYTPFSEKWLPAPKNGTEKIANRAMVHIQNVALCGSGFFKYLIAWVRCSSIPSVKGKSILSKPPKKFVVSRVQPTPMLPYPEAFVVAKIIKLIPRIAVNSFSHLVERRLMKIA